MVSETTLFFELFEHSMYKAIEDSLERNPGYTYRRICREFSRNFHTPLKQVEAYPIGYVLQMVLESRLDDQDPEQIVEFGSKVVKTPDEIRTDEQEMAELIKKMEVQEEEKKNKSKIKKDEKKQTLEKEFEMKFDGD